VGLLPSDLFRSINKARVFRPATCNSTSKQGAWTSKAPASTGWSSLASLERIFHGVGVINGGPNCQFQADAWDNFQPGSLDAFGIKIYSCDNGHDRYIVPATPLTTGSIVIHK
jgi:hypothetical protein